MNLIFDIGCNTGDFYETALSKYNCKVVAVDGNSKFVFNPHRKDLELLNYVVSSKDNQERILYIDEHQTGVSTVSSDWKTSSRFALGNKYLRPNNTTWDKQVRVETITLDSLIDKYGKPDLIKVDVEGHEFEVFEGLSQKVDKICFEWAEEGLSNMMMCLGRLVELGYTQFGLIGFFEGEYSDKFTFSYKGDPHLVEPLEYLSEEDFVCEVNNYLNPNRRISWGMVWAK